MGAPRRIGMQRSFVRPRNPGIKFTAVATFVGIVMNGIISGIGYLDIAGYLSHYGINISEAGLPFSSYLFYGYIYILDYWTYVSNAGWWAVVGLVLLVFSAIWLLLKKYYPVSPTSNIVLFAYLLASISCLIPAIPIITAYSHGQNSASNELRSKFHSFGLVNYKLRKTFYLKGGEKLVGWSLFSSPDYTWVVVDDSVYKYSNAQRAIIVKIDYNKINIPSSILRSELRVWQVVSGRKYSKISVKVYIFK